MRVLWVCFPSNVSVPGIFACAIQPMLFQPNSKFEETLAWQTFPITCQRQDWFGAMTEKKTNARSDANHPAQSPRRTTNYAMRVFYALAILFVVAGHSSINYPSGFNFGYNLFPVYAFHMPMFVFASGYFYNCRHEKNPWGFVTGKARRLILPMYAIHALTCLFVMLLASKGFSPYEGISISLRGILIDPWTHSNMHDYGYDLAMWFLIPMFLSQCAYMLAHAVVVRGEEGSRTRHALDAILTLAMVVGGVMLMDAVGTGEANEAIKSSDWLRLCQTGCFLPFTAVGYYYRNYLERYADKVSDVLALVSLALVQLGLLFAYGGNFTMLMCWVGFPTGGLGALFIGMNGTLFWLRVSKMLAPRLRDSRIVNEIGQNTFSIMAFHFFGFFVLNCLFLVAYVLSGGRLGAFSVEAFKLGGIYYKCIPGRMLDPSLADSWGMLYVIFGIGVPLILHRIWAWVSASIRSLVKDGRKTAPVMRTSSE